MCRAAAGMAAVALGVCGVAGEARADKGITYDWTAAVDTGDGTAGANTCNTLNTGCGNVYASGTTFNFTTPAFIAGANKYLVVTISVSDPTVNINSVALDPAGVNTPLARIGSRDNNATTATCEAHIWGGVH
jgi:hypothetical protein